MEASDLVVLAALLLHLRLGADLLHSRLEKMLVPLQQGSTSRGRRMRSPSGEPMPLGGPILIQVVVEVLLGEGAGGVAEQAGASDSSCNGVAMVQ